MLKKVYPKTNLLAVQNVPPINQSIGSINNSYLHEGYQSYIQSTGSPGFSPCFHCKSIGNTALISPCDCEDKLFHLNCLKEWLGQTVDKSDYTLKSSGDNNFLTCHKCKREIKFKSQSVYRTRNYEEVVEYCGEKRINVAAIVISILLMLGCLIYLTLLALNVFQICTNCVIYKQAIVIGLGVASGILFVVLICCCHDCFRVAETKVETLYDREGRSHRSNRSRSRSKGNLSNHSYSASPSPRSKKEPMERDQVVIQYID